MFEQGYMSEVAFTSLASMPLQRYIYHIEHTFPLVASTFLAAILLQPKNHLYAYLRGIIVASTFLATSSRQLGLLIGMCFCLVKVASTSLAASSLQQDRFDFKRFLLCRLHMLFWPPAHCNPC